MLGASFPPGASRRLVAAFVLLLVVPAVALVWLGVRYVIQDRDREADELRAQREAAAERIVTELSARLAAAEEDLGSQEPPGDDAVRVVLGARSIETIPARRLLYQPGLQTERFEVRSEFAPGWELEQQNDLRAAEGAYRTLAAEASPDARAVALVRLARVLRHQGKSREALEVYDDLARVQNVRVDGVPADLAARRARCLVFEAEGDLGQLREEAAALRADLLAGRWPIDRGTFEQYARIEVARWLGAETRAAATDLALAEAVEWLWERRGTAGRTATHGAGLGVVLLWKTDGDRTRALVAGPSYQERAWRSALRPGPGEEGLRAELALPNGPTPGTASEDDRFTLRRRAAHSDLPWDVAVSSGTTLPGGAMRRRLILAGLGFLVLLVVAGGSLVSRAISRELAVARLQSDFVASVSHEFRTPLTSLRQFTDLLNEAEDLPPEKRRQFYAAQSRATERLQRLVESLLDFKRMEAGTHPYQCRPVPASALVQGVVEDFRPEAAARGFEVEYAHSDESRTIDADPQALSLALWNLLDNAVKYSGENRRVWVSTAQQNGSVVISVRDRGLGVPLEEQREIFGKFVRGRDARIQSIKGTGIGLAMVQHIVQGHSGRVTLESAPGQGSTFTIVLPASGDCDL